jgi:hypothetical protein
MTIVKTFTAAAVLALVAIGPANACSYAKQDTSAEAPKPAEVATAPAAQAISPAPAAPAATASTATAIASAEQTAAPAVKPN